jgi:hypothetical protein
MPAKLLFTEGFMAKLIKIRLGSAMSPGISRR